MPSITNLNGSRGGTMNLGAATVGPTMLEGTNANTIKSTVATTFAIDGIIYAKAITDNIAMTALAAQAADTTCLYAICANSSGTISIVKGVEKGTASATQASESMEYPEATAGTCMISAMKIVTTVAYTCGTTDLGTSGVTETFQNILQPPSGTLAS